MAFPPPIAGMVIRYAYPWLSEHERGLEEGKKDRPCAITMTVKEDSGDLKVLLLPITHTPPDDPTHAVEIPAATKRRLGLDDERSWIMITETNRFRWPGPDLRPARPGDPASIVYGELPGNLFKHVRDKWIAYSIRTATIVTRTE